MRTQVPHNVLTLSEMNKRPNRLSLEVIPLDQIVLTDEMIKKLRSSSSMFNKSTYVQVTYDGVKYNVESVDRVRTGRYKISLISTVATATATGNIGSAVDTIRHRSL